MAKRKSKVPTVYFGVRLPVDVVARVRQRALENDRAIGAEMARILRCALDGTSLSSFEAGEEAKRREAAREALAAVMKADERAAERNRAKQKLERLRAKRKTERGK